MTERATYTHGHSESVLRSHKWRTAENSAGYLLPHLVPGRSILDVGCGPGTITIDLARRVAPGRVVGIDPAADAVGEAAAAAGAAGLSVDVRVADLFDLPFPPASFDVVHAHQVLQHLSDPVGALVAMRGACAPGGVVAVRDADYAAFAWYPEAPAIDRWLDIYRAVARTNGGEPDAGRRLLGWALAAGFSPDALTPSASAWCFATPDDRAWWADTWATRTTDTRLADRAVELGLATTDELAAIADGWRAWAALDDAWFVVPHGELLAAT